MSIGQRIKELRNERGMSRTALAERVDMPYATLAGIENNDQASSTQLPEIAEALQAHVRYLKTGKGPKWLGDAPVRLVSSSETAPNYLRFDLYEGGAGMGAGLINQDYPEVIRTLEVAEWEIRRKLGYLPKPGRIQLITGRGPSMRPKIEDGDVVMVDTSVTFFDGDDYYLINVDGETQIKMLQKRDDGLYAVSSNPDFPSWKVDQNNLAVAGKVMLGMGIRRM